MQNLNVYHGLTTTQQTTNSTAEQAIIGFENGAGYEVYFSRSGIGTYNSPGNSISMRLTDISGITYTVKSEMNSSGISQEVNGCRTSSGLTASAAYDFIAGPVANRYLPSGN